MKIDLHWEFRNDPDLLRMLGPKPKVSNRNPFAMRFYRVRGSKTMYCYTPNKDRNGNYWTYNYVLHGRRYEKKNITKARTRKTAKARALKRYNAAYKRKLHHAKV